MMDESFELPVCNNDLQDLIESNITAYYLLPLNRKETSKYKHKLNELILELNDRRQMHIYNLLK